MLRFARTVSGCDYSPDLRLGMDLSFGVGRSKEAQEWESVASESSDPNSVSVITT